jgi:hypothetical protein
MTGVVRDAQLSRSYQEDRKGSVPHNRDITTEACFHAQKWLSPVSDRRSHDHGHLGGGGGEVGVEA